MKSRERYNQNRDNKMLWPANKTRWKEKGEKIYTEFAREKRDRACV